MQTIFYTTHQNQVVTDSSMAKLLAKLPARPPFNHRYLQDYLLNGYFASSDNLHETLFEGIYRVPLGYQLRINGSKACIERAWSLKDPQDNSEDISFAQAAELLKEKLMQAIAITESKKHNIATELSGGLDSSSVAAILRTSLPNQTIFAFTNGVPSQIPSWFSKLNKADKKSCLLHIYDESAWSKQVADSLQLEHQLITQGYHFHDIIEQYTEILGSFTEVLFPLLNHHNYELCHSLGIKTLFSGFGGDEVVSQYANLYLRELYDCKAYFSAIYEKIRNKKASDWLRTLHLLPQKKSNWHRPTEHLAYLRLPDLLAEQKTLPTHTTVQAREYDFIEGTMSLHWQRRIETSTIIAQHYGIDYQYPLTYPPLMSFFHQLPSSYKHRHGKGRYLLRSCMKGLLPKAVIWRQDKAGGTAPAAWINLLEHLPEIFLSRITPSYSGALSTYVDIPKLIRRLEAGPIVNSNLVRLVITVIMFAHLEKIS